MGRKSEETNYAAEAESDAKAMVAHFIDEIVDKLLNDGEASDDYDNDYEDGDSYHHETHVDRGYNLTEATDLLDWLSQHEETDSGLWDGLDPRDAICTQAAYTYGNAVTAYWFDFIQKINRDSTIFELLEQWNAEENPDGRSNYAYDLKQCVLHIIGYSSSFDTPPEPEEARSHIAEIEDASGVASIHSREEDATTYAGLDNLGGNLGRHPVGMTYSDRCGGAPVTDPVPALPDVPDFSRDAFKERRPLVGKRDIFGYEPDSDIPDVEG